MQESSQDPFFTSLLPGNAHRISRGYLLFQTYDNDEETRGKFWDMLCDRNEPLDSGYRVVIRGSPVWKDITTNPHKYYFFGEDKNHVCLKHEYRKQNPDMCSDESSPKDPPEASAAQTGCSRALTSASSVKTNDDAKCLQEMTEHLRSVLHIGDADIANANSPKTIDPKPKDGVTPKATKPAPDYRLTPKTGMQPVKPRSTPKTTGKKLHHSIAHSTTSPRKFDQRSYSPAFSPLTARVPFTARQPKPPPFLPTFPDDDDADVIVIADITPSSESQSTPNFAFGDGQYRQYGNDFGYRSDTYN